MPTDEPFTAYSIPRNVKPSSDFISYADEKTYTQQQLKQEESYIFNYRIDEADDAVRQQLKKFPMLSTMFDVTTGTKPYQTNKGLPPQTEQTIKDKPFTKKEKQDDTWRPYMCGSTMNRFTDTWKFDGTYIKYGEWLAEPRFIEGDKIIIRQTGDSLIATIDNGGVNNNTLHSVTPKSDTTISLYYVLGLLNSVLLNWYFKKENFLEDGKTLAEVKGAHVRNLPLATGSDEQVIKIEEYVHKLLNLCQQRFEERYKLIHYIDKKYTPKSLSGKMKAIEEIDFDVWCKELKAQKCKLTAQDEMNLLSLYESAVEKIKDFDSKIKAISDQMNEIVYEVYGIDKKVKEKIKDEMIVVY